MNRIANRFGRVCNAYHSWGIISLLLLCLCCSIATADIIYVNADAPFGGDGVSWGTAYKHLQDALSVAQDGDKIWVAKGIYTPDANSLVPDGSGNREATFQLINGVVLYGGFPTGGGNWEERDPNKYETVLSGDLAGDDIHDPNKTENSYHVVTVSYSDPNTILDGFTITAGNAGGPEPDNRGAGIYNESGERQISNCKILNNSAGYFNFDPYNFVNYPGEGGGMYNRTANPILSNCSFTSNSATISGGGIYIDSGTATMNNCTFTGNSAGLFGIIGDNLFHTIGGGGAVYNYASSPLMTNCHFTYNEGTMSGGAVYNDANSHPIVTNCTFSNNHAIHSGGAMYNDANSNPVLTDCAFIQNSAETVQITSYGGEFPTTIIIAWGSGGGIFNQLSSPTIKNCTFTGNFSLIDGGGMSNTESAPNITNCSFAGNWAKGFQWEQIQHLGWGGAVSSDNGNPAMTNCTFAGNRADNGNALACDSEDELSPSVVHLSNCILWNGGDEIWNNDNSIITTTYSDVHSGYPGLGNIDDDPLFVDPNGPDSIIGTEDDNLRLQADSACIDAGDNSVVEPNSTDLDGNPRIVNSTVDMGAYEFQEPRTFYVDDDASDDPGPGNSDVSDPLENGTEAHPFDAIQEGIDATWHGDTVVVLDGTYTGQGNRDIDFAGKAITLRSTDPNDPDVVAATIIDCQGDPCEPHRGFYFHTGEEQNSVLDGFTITNGCAGEGGGIMCWESSPTITNNIITLNRTSFDADGGGGIKCRGGSPTIINNTISHNSCPPGGGGGGIRCYEADSPTITDNIISHNTASQGAGIQIQFCTPTISNCTFTANSTDGMGGGIITNSDIILANCIFSGNTAGKGAGVYIYHSNPTLLNCSFIDNSADYSGGGMYNNNSSPTVTGCSFTRNFAWDGEGAGIYNRDNSSPTVTDCTFINNWSEGGSGISNYWYSDPNVTGCTFTENGVEGPGGGMFNWQYCSPTVANCTFVGNSANRGGGMCSDGHCDPTVTGCTFTDNWAYTGGGMCNDDNCEPTVTGCSFGGNWASYDGGGMYNSSSSPTVTNCTFTGNSANGTYAYGGGMCNVDSSSPEVISCTFTSNRANHGSGGGMYNMYSNPILTNCTFTGNSASYGGGISNEWCSYSILTNCTFTGNSADINGGGMNIYDCCFGDPVSTNCIFWGNSDSGGMDESAQIYNTGFCSVFINYSCIQGWTGGLGGSGNHGNNPLFVDADGTDNTPGTEDDNLRLLPWSPCIDAGDNSVVEPNSTDLDGNPRIINGIVDMGAYEAPVSIGAIVHIVPRVINRRGHMKRIIAIMRLPEGVGRRDVADEPFELYPGDLDDEPIEATWQRVIGWGNMTRVSALFDKDELMEVVPGIGRKELTIVGRLESGQYILGSDTVRIVQPRRRRPHWQAGKRRRWKR